MQHTSMKSPEEIKTDIELKKTELGKLVNDHQQQIAEFTQRTTLAQSQADRLQGAITALEALIAEP